MGFETTETPFNINFTVVDPDPAGDSGTMLTAAVAFFTCGCVLFVTSLVCWMVYCMRRRSKGHPIGDIQPSVRSSAPSRSRGLEISSQYVGYDASLDASVHMYDALQSDQPRHHQAYPAVTEVSQGEFEETFDGSRMPRYKAPAVPPNDSAFTGNDQRVTEISIDQDQTSINLTPKSTHLETTGMEKRPRNSSYGQHDYDEANVGESRLEDAVTNTDYEVIVADMHPGDADQGELTMSLEEQRAPPLPARRSMQT